MLWVAIFTETDDPGDIRQQEKEAHFAYLRANRDRIKYAGALRAAPGERPQGGLWIFEAADRTEVEAIIDADPYFRAGLSAAVRICSWGPGGEGFSGVTY